MTVRKRGEHLYVDISEKGRHQVQRVLKGARTKAQALKAEARLRTQIFEKRYGLVERPECRFDKFVDASFLPTKQLKKSYKSIFGWSDIRMAMRYTHAMEDAKRRAVEAIAVGTKTANQNAAISISRDSSMTNEKRQALGSP